MPNPILNNAAGIQLEIDRRFPSIFLFTREQALELSREIAPGAQYSIKTSERNRYCSSELASIFETALHKNKKPTRAEKLQRIRQTLDAYWEQKGYKKRGVAL